MGLVQRVIHEMAIAKGGPPLCVMEGSVTNWEPHFCWLPTRMFCFETGFGKRVWLRTVERRFCKAADWLGFGPVVWPEYRPTNQEPRND